MPWTSRPSPWKEARAAAANLPIAWLEHDLDLGFDPPATYDVIVNIRYVNLPLLAELLGSLRPGGLLLVEQHLGGYQDVVGPSNPAFRVTRGELAELAAALLVEELPRRAVRGSGRTRRGPGSAGGPKTRAEC